MRGGVLKLAANAKTLAMLLTAMLLSLCAGSVFAQASDLKISKEAPAALRQAFEHLLAEDFEQARALAEPLAAKNDPDAQHLLGYLEERGLGGEKNTDRAIELYHSAALAGSVDAQFALGEMAFFGDGVMRDRERAAGWYRMAAANDHAGAQTRLGVLHAEGSGVARDQNVALSLFQKAAAAGDPSAQYYLGGAYLAGDGVDQDYNKAGELFQKAAEQGHPDAQYNLALLHDSSFLGQPDPEKTLKWLLAAADGALPASFVALGLMAHQGGAPIAEAGAADWFQRAAEAGDPQGQFLYAVALSEGDGREKNVGEALVWIDRALSSDRPLTPEIKQNAEALREKLTGSALQ